MINGLTDELLLQTMEDVDMGAELSDTESLVLHDSAEMEWKEGSVESGSESENAQDTTSECMPHPPSSRAPSSCPPSSLSGFCLDDDVMDIYSDGEHQALVESVALEDLAPGPSTAKPKAASAIHKGLSLMEEDPTIKPRGLFQFFKQGTKEDFQQYVAREDDNHQAYIEEVDYEIEQFEELQYQNKKERDRLHKQKSREGKKQVEVQKGLCSPGGSKKRVSCPMNVRSASLIQDIR